MSAWGVDVAASSVEAYVEGTASASPVLADGTTPADHTGIQRLVEGDGE